MEKEFWIRTEDGTAVYVKKWYTPNLKPKAIIQLSHGMVEHINRYSEFAKHLVRQQIFVYGNDHRGHGKTGVRQGMLGYLAENDGFVKTAEDLHLITNEIKKDHSDVPIFLFGHSMGSFLARYYIQYHSESIHAVILSGTGYYPIITSLTGRQLAAMLPPKKESKLMNSLAFGSYNKKVMKKISTFDWLSSDESAVETYTKDPLTGFIPKGRFFYDLMSGLLAIQKKNYNKAIRNNLPMLIISGDRDPVGDYEKGVWKTACLYKKAGLEKITTMLFAEGRHELLNEKNKTEVYKAITDWMDNYL
ncbi:lysophospholipase [Virgibacillus ainsalahensis]